MQNEKTSLFIVKATWQNEKGSFAKEAVICAENKDEAIGIMKNHIPRKIETVDMPITVRCICCGKPRGPRAYYTTEPVRTDKKDPDAISLSQATMIDFAIKWGQYLANSGTDQKAQTLLSDSDFAAQKITEWATAYMDRSGGSGDTFFNTRMRHITSLPVPAQASFGSLKKDDAYALIEKAMEACSAVVSMFETLSGSANDMIDKFNAMSGPVNELVARVTETTHIDDMEIIIENLDTELAEKPEQPEQTPADESTPTETPALNSEPADETNASIHKQTESQINDAPISNEPRVYTPLDIDPYKIIAWLKENAAHLTTNTVNGNKPIESIIPQIENAFAVYGNTRDTIRALWQVVLETQYSEAKMPIRNVCLEECCGIPSNQFVDELPETDNTQSKTEKTDTSPANTNTEHADDECPFP